MARDVSVRSKSMLNECRYVVILHPLSRQLSSGRALVQIMIIRVASMFIADLNLAYGDVFTWHFDDR